MKSGEILHVIADDPVAPQNIDAWAKKSGNKVLAVKQEGRTFNIFVQRI
jgi:TusA-related sulfurtransferase